MVNIDRTPKKSLGQHWLYDPGVLAEIVDLADIRPGEKVIEVGPGLGTLTDFLLQADAHVTAVEFDNELYDDLVERSGDFISKSGAKAEFMHENILNYRFDNISTEYKVVANIPYYLTSNLIRKLSETTHQPKKIVLLIQKEVAERLCAKPGEMSLLSVWAQMYFSCRLGPVVPAKLFMPPPKVDSQVVVLDRLDSPIDSEVDRKLLARLIKAGFSNKRKTLHNSLSGGLQLTKDQAKTLLEDALLSPIARPQELRIDDWLRLAQVFRNKNT